MVLEAAFDDSSPSSDFDPYDSSGKSSQPSNDVFIDLSKASRPFPILGPLTGFNNQSLLKMTVDIAREAPRIIRRPLTQDEVDAVVTSVSRYQQVHSWVYSSGLIMGAFSAQATKAEMGFPAGRFFRNMSLNLERFGPLQGPFARAAWNTIRVSLWFGWWGLPAYIIGGVVGQMAMAQKQLTDERLKEFHQDMRSDSAKKRLGNAVQRRQQGLPQPPIEQISEQSPDVDGTSSQLRSGTTLERSEDMRRRGMESSMRSSSNEPTPGPPTGRTEVDVDRQRYARQNEASSYSAPEQQSSQNATGGSAWDRVRGQAAQKESAWDKVRRGSSGSSEQSPTAPNNWQSQRSNVFITDSFTFDERDEDRQLAKTEAQKEFDARVERERQGKDFDDSRSGGKRW